MIKAIALGEKKFSGQVDDVHQLKTQLDQFFIALKNNLLFTNYENDKVNSLYLISSFFL